MKRNKTRLEIIGEEFISIAKCIEYFKLRNKKSVTCRLHSEYIPLLESLGYKISANIDGLMELSWDE